MITGYACGGLMTALDYQSLFPHCPCQAAFRSRYNLGEIAKSKFEDPDKLVRCVKWDWVVCTCTEPDNSALKLTLQPTTPILPVSRYLNRVKAATKAPQHVIEILIELIEG